MSLISTVSFDKATGKVAELYSKIVQRFERIPNGLQILSGSPKLLENQWQEMTYYFSHPKLSRTLLATIRMLISQQNQCEYCLDFNTSLLINRFGWTPEQVTATQQNPQKAPLDEKEKAMLLFVLKSVWTPLAVTKQDVQALQTLGWEEGDILDATTHGAHHVARDILFNTFKVEKDF
jgi:AhpD family alkylhydroperoxidase